MNWYNRRPTASVTRWDAARTRGDDKILKIIFPKAPISLKTRRITIPGRVYFHFSPHGRVWL